MTKFIPLFPLNIVVFPNEELNLHIFEPRYKQLVTECFEHKKEFGILTVLETGISEYGTSIEIMSIDKIHANGELDIKTKGKQAFRLLEHIATVPEKLYDGGIVSFIEGESASISEDMLGLLKQLKAFHELLQIQKHYKKAEHLLNSFDIGHYAGLTLNQELELLKLDVENDRIHYLQNHLASLMTTMRELQNLKSRIQMNGHFRKSSIDDNDTQNF